MRIYCEADYDAMSRRAANLISAEVIRRPDCVLGLATGSTPIGTYKQLLGLGRNGHIGFNEPCDYFVKPTHVVDLSQSTIDANSRFFASENDVQKQAITMGIGCIMAAKRVLLIANGSDKADAVYRAFCGPINPNCPASILQLHNDVVLVGDEKALSRLIASGMKI